MARGRLRIYLGAAPGVGKTFAMLNEGKRREARGTDVVVGLVETHGRANTAAQIGDLEVVSRRRISYRGTDFEEMDVDAVLARKAQVALIDEIAHTNVPGSRNEKRWQDVAEVLNAGIDVISTLNMQHLESVNDVVERITGGKQHETIPDAIVRAAEQVELVDMTPEALRRRLAHGNIYPPDRIDASLGNYFRPGNLAALRELALLWVADKVDESLQDYMDDHGIRGPWETRERVVVAITGAPGGDALIRRAARMAMRAHAELLGVHVRSTDGLAGPPKQLLDEHRALLNELGGTYHEIVGDDIGKALIEFARAENATQLVLGASRRSRWAELTRGSVINRVIRASGPIDVHVISSEEPESEAPFSRPRGRRALSLRRQATGALVGVVLLPVLTLVMVGSRDGLGLPGVLLLYLLAVVAIAAIGGVWPALAASFAAFVLANWYFISPLHEWTIHEGKDLIALVVFLLVAGVVSALVSAAARRSAAEASDLRVALLAAVSHDLRTPLSSIKAAATSLLQQDIEWTPQATRELLTTIDEESDRLNTLVGNLLDMSRLQSGALELTMRDIGLEEVVPSAIKGLGERGYGVETRVDETLPRVHADAALLERAVANVVDNALAWSPPDTPVRVEAGAIAGRVH